MKQYYSDISELSSLIFIKKSILGINLSLTGCSGRSGENVYNGKLKHRYRKYYTRL